MTPEEALERAAVRVARGEWRAARDVLRHCLRADPDSIPIRAALAQIYRDEGYPDQAGRWGALVPNGSTERERLLMARWFRAGGLQDERRARRLFELPRGRPVPEDLQWVIVDAERVRRFGMNPGVPWAQRRQQWARWAFRAAVALACASLVVWIAGAATVYVHAWAGGGGLRLLARQFSVVVIALEVGASVAASVTTALRGRWILCALWIAIAAVSALALGHIAADPGRVLFWEA